ncbi:MAG TPA: hypothetical protein VF475_14690 [Sphingobium sp.]
MGGVRILSDRQIEEMAQLRERGWGVQRIADHFTQGGTPISASCIGRHRQAKAPFTRNGYVIVPFSADEDARLRKLDGEGVPMVEICR